MEIAVYNQMMATIEPNRVASAEEYERLRGERIRENEIRPETVYAFLGRLAYGEASAAKLVVKTRKVGSATVEMAFLDEDFDVQMKWPGEMNDGLWIPKRSSQFYIEYQLKDRDMTKAPITESYVMDYDEGLGMPTIEQALSVRSPREELGV